MANKISLSTILGDIADLQNQIDQIESGGEVQANINLKNLYKVVNSISPTNPNDLATKNYVDQQINDVETGTISLLFNSPNQIIYGSTNPSPDFPTKYLGTQGFLTNNNVDTNANISGSKLLDSSIPNSKLTTVDGSRLVNLSVTDEKISSVASTKITGSISQSQVTNLPADLASINSKFPITDTNVSSSANIQQSKIQNLVSNLATINSQISSLQLSTMTNVTYINQGTTTNIDTFINNAPSGTCFALSPSSPSFTLSNPATITTSNNAISLTGFAKSYLATSNTTSITGFGTFTLKALNLQYYFCNINLTCPTFLIQGGNVVTPTTLAFASENCNLNAAITIQNSAGFMNFFSTSFGGNITIDGTTLCSAIYFTNCNMQNKIVLNNSSTTLIFQNCVNLNSLSISNAIFSGFMTMNSGISYNFTTFPAPMNPITQQPYRWTSSDLNPSANILGTQLSSSANILGTQLSSSANILGSQISSSANILGSQLSTNSIPLNKISNSGATNGQVITFNGTNIVWGTSASTNLLPLNNTWTGTNDFSNSVTVSSPTTNQNPLTLKYFNDYTYLNSILYGMNCFAWFDFSQSELARTYFRTSDSAIVVQSFGNCINANYPFRLKTDQTTTNMPRLITETFGSVNRTFLSFTTVASQLQNDTNLSSVDNCPANELTIFIVFRPTLISQLSNTLLSTDNVGGGWNKAVSFTTSSARNGGWTTTDICLGINVGTLNGVAANGTYLLTYGASNLATDRITMTSLTNQKTILCLSYTTRATTTGVVNLRRDVCMNAWLTCNNSTVGYDMKVGTDVSCYAQDNIEKQWVLGDRTLPGTSSTPYTGDVFEILMYGSRELTNNQRQLVTTYLFNKWLA